MATLYTELRAEMKRKGVQNHDVGRWLNLSDQSVSNRLSGHCPWTQPEMYAVMDKLHIPLSKLHIVFPKDGMWAGPLDDPPPTEDQKMLEALKAFIRKERTA